MSMFSLLPPRIASKIVVQPNGCWLWTGAKTSTGYGNVFAGRVASGKKRYAKAHRYVYELVNGPVDDALILDHRCRTSLCVCPDHLDPISQKENIRRGLGHGHETFCPHGHRYDADNTYRDRSGRRYCRQCARDKEERFRLTGSRRLMSVGGQE